MEHCCGSQQQKGQDVAHDESQDGLFLKLLESAGVSASRATEMVFRVGFGIVLEISCRVLRGCRGSKGRWRKILCCVG